MIPTNPPDPTSILINALGKDAVRQADEIRQLVESELSTDEDAVDWNAVDWSVINNAVATLNMTIAMMTEEFEKRFPEAFQEG